jgi:hypothetical protein
MTDEKQEPAEDDEPREKSRKGLDVRTPTRDEFFANLEQVSRPDDEGNGEKASKPETEGSA